MTDAIKKLKARDEFIAFAESETKEKFGKLNAIQQSHALRSLSVFDDRVEVIGLQVINGAQTVKALVNAGRQRLNQPDPWSKHTPSVLVRITEIPGGYGDSAKVREQVTQFNNTQNVVKVSDFKAGVVTAYKTSKKYEAGFVHRNWMRGKDTPGKIAEILSDTVLSVREPLGDIPLE
jgi:hypothetical protein